MRICCDLYDFVAQKQSNPRFLHLPADFLNILERKLHIFCNPLVKINLLRYNTYCYERKRLGAQASG